MNTNVSDIKAEKSETLPAAKKKNKNAKNTKHSFLSIMQLVQQAGAAMVSGTAAQPASSDAELNNSKSLLSQKSSAAKNTQKMNHVLEPAATKIKSAEKKTVVHGLAKEDIIGKVGFDHKNNDFQKAQALIPSPKPNHIHRTSKNSDALLMIHTANTKQGQTKTDLNSDTHLNINRLRSGTAEQQTMHDSLAKGQQNAETATLNKTRLLLQPHVNQLNNHAKNERDSVTSQRMLLGGQEKEFSGDYNQSSSKKVNAKDSPAQTDHSKIQIGLENHRAATGQMSKLELWTAFQSGKNVESQGSVHEQVANHLSEWLGKASFKLEKNGTQSFTVTLYPEHLGKLVISVGRGEQGLTAQLTAETQRAKDLLESGLGQLKHDCAGRGITLTQIDVNRQLYQPSSDSSSSQGQQQGSSRQGNPQEENQDQHKQSHRMDTEAEQNDHSFLEFMTGGGI
ncbi:flagellar hook-length control protein FliK [Sporolactobacillus shoreicorticis]|uniref:Flagellar hook-length control protein FliK n=1 Tax=Sporolactobacillus shoreicorticis TaxID=1923877 RepID=A0ABW5S7X7_9BACL|nr:flagellar hook-length control protein FliK [Sporolactobacillus shoreicorticis]MCO7125994.1 flagellar hook-length control protein FliK [Sporolactobacillus shoreicorticis]